MSKLLVTNIDNLYQEASVEKWALGYCTFFTFLKLPSREQRGQDDPSPGSGVFVQIRLRKAAWGGPPILYSQFCCLSFEGQVGGWVQRCCARGIGAVLCKTYCFTPPYFCGHWCTRLSNDTERERPWPVVLVNIAPINKVSEAIGVLLLTVRNLALVIGFACPVPPNNGNCSDSCWRLSEKHIFVCVYMHTEIPLGTDLLACFCVSWKVQFTLICLSVHNYGKTCTISGHFSNLLYLHNLYITHSHKNDSRRFTQLKQHTIKIKMNQKTHSTR